jgi:MFS family permease
MLVPTETRGAAFGWLAMGVQIGTAASPLVTGALAAVNLRSAFLVNGALAWIAAAILFIAARELLHRQR